MMSRRPPHGKPRHALDCAPRSGAFGAVLAHAERIIDLDRQLAAWLDEPLKAHCRIAALDAGAVVLETDSPVWSHRVRFLLPTLARHFARRVVLRVRPPEPRRPSPALTPRPLSTETATMLQGLADSLDNRPLGDVLRRLATRR